MDDAIDQKQAANIEQMLKAWNNYEEAIFTRLTRGAPQMNIGTRWSADDFISELLKDKDWVLIHVPAIDQRTGRSVWPRGKTTKELLKIKHDKPELFQVQYQGDPSAKGIGIIKSKGDKILFGGHSTKDMKKKLKIKEREPLADYLPTVTIGAKIFANGMTMYNAEEKDLRGECLLTEEHVLSNTAVRTTLIERGIKPEELPKEENIKKIKKTHKKSIQQQTKEISSSSYIEYENEPELRPEFIKKMKEIKKQKSIKVDDFAKRYT